MLRFPQQASGLLVSGSAMASLISINVARNLHASIDVKQAGLASANKRLIIYASEQTHRTIHRAVEILGLGLNQLRIIPVNPFHQIDLDALDQAIAYDVTQGHQPFCVVGNAGTTTTGAFDNLTELAKICQKYQLWFHVDGAFGALTRLSEKYSYLTNGLELADSVAFDFHKWLHMPYELGCVLIKNAQAHKDGFEISHPYLPGSQSGMTAGIFWPADYGIELSRSFKALKAWFLIKEHGIKKFGQLIDNNIAQAHYLKKLILPNPQLELIAAISLNIVCFRFVSKLLDDSALNLLNQAITLELQNLGSLVVSDIAVDGKIGLRAAFFNYKAQQEDLDFLINSVLTIGNRKIVYFIKTVKA
jgi:aromatic-L-amino-acid decarboxylase